MKYTQKSFSSGPASKEYRDNYERTFGKKPDTGAGEEPAAAARELTELAQELGAYADPTLCRGLAMGNKLCTRPRGHKGDCA